MSEPKGRQALRAAAAERAKGPRLPPGLRSDGRATREGGTYEPEASGAERAHY